MSMAIARKIQAKRQRILETSLEIFSERGYVATPVREIIDRSGYGTGTFYKHFAGKEEVLTTLLSRFLDQIIENVDNYYGFEDDLYTRFIETKRVIMQSFIDNAPLAEIYSRVAGISPGIDACLKEFDDRFLAFANRNLRYGMEKGVFRDLPAEPIAHSILAVTKYAVYKWIVMKELTEEEMVEMVLSFHRSMAQGLVNPAAIPASEQIRG